MQPYKKQFIEFCLENKIIQFGEFTLKSGRRSPYFFNSGLFNNGQTIARLGKFYAAAIKDANLDFDVLFGPAYKGIPLVVTTAIALAEDFQINKPFCFNRKVAKDHGEGGNLVGAKLQGKVLIIDDVITAGTAISEIAAIIREADAELAGVCIALDRQEKGANEKSAICQIKRQYQCKVASIITLQDLLEFTKAHPDLTEYFTAICAYQEKYGSKK